MFLDSDKTFIFVALLCLSWLSKKKKFFCSCNDLMTKISTDNVVNHEVIYDY
jgi:hypothetical protein